MATLDTARMQRLASALDANNSAIRAKGVTVPSGTKFDEQAALIANISALTIKSGGVMLDADSAVLTLPEEFDGSLAFWVCANLDEAKAKGTNTIYEALGVMPPDRGTGPNTIYRSINASGGLAMSGTSPVADEDGHFLISISKTWRAGLLYDYIIWYGGN